MSKWVGRGVCLPKVPVGGEFIPWLPQLLEPSTLLSVWPLLHLQTSASVLTSLLETLTLLPPSFKDPHDDTEQS